MTHGMQGGDEAIGKALYRLISDTKSPLIPHELTEREINDLLTHYWINRRTDNVFSVVFKWIKSHLTDYVIVSTALHGRLRTKNLFALLAFDIISKVYKNDEERTRASLESLESILSAKNKERVSTDTRSGGSSVDDVIASELLDNSETNVEDASNTLSGGIQLTFSGESSFDQPRRGISLLETVKAESERIDITKAFRQIQNASYYSLQPFPDNPNRSLTNVAQFEELYKLLPKISYTDNRVLYRENINKLRELATLHLLVELTITKQSIQGPRHEKVDYSHYNAVEMCSKSLCGAIMRYVRSQTSSQTTMFAISHIAPFIEHKTNLEHLLALERRT